MESGKLTLEKIEGTLEEIFKENQIPRFSPSVEKEVTRKLRNKISTNLYGSNRQDVCSFIL